MKFTAPAFVVGTLVATGIQVAHETCSRAVSTDSEFHNDYCMALCEELSTEASTPLSNEAFTKKCAIAHYKVQNGRVSPDNGCFNNAVYGYSEGTSHDSLVPDLYYATPALCQLACQDNQSCVQWSWASELVATPNGRQRCLLKSLDMVQGALAQDTSDASAVVDPAFCNTEIPHMCANSLYECLSCDSKHRCAWKSHLHISGWKSCATEVDQCEGNVVIPTEEVPPKYPVCNEYVSINPTLTNDYCMESCNVLMASGGSDALTSNAEFVEDCAHEHYTVGEAAKPSGTCFNNLVIGYSQESNLASMEDTQGLYVDTPAQCQLHCQHHPECESFVFVTELIASTGSQDVHKCLLKSKKMVKEALSVNVAAENVSVPAQYCNVNMPYMCNVGGYECLSCKEGEKSCAWSSVYHIAGQKHCASTTKTCDLA